MSPRMTFLGYKPGKRLREYSCLNRAENREQFYGWKFSKVNAVRKGKSGTHGKEEISFKFFSQGEGNIKTILVTS